jgi:hypothetical protein
MLLSLTIHTGPGTEFGENDKWNPNPHLACSSIIGNKMDVKDTMPVVAHRTLPCGSIVIICSNKTNKCTQAVVADRLGNHCKRVSNRQCIEYWSILDMTKAVTYALGIPGGGNVTFFEILEDEWKRRKNIRKLKQYIRLNS